MKNNKDEFEKDFRNLQNLTYFWIIFVAVIVLLAFCGIGYVIIRVMAYFGI